jgi:hypothetical protein
VSSGLYHLLQRFGEGDVEDSLRLDFVGPFAKGVS